MFQYIVDCILCAKGYSKLRVFKKPGDLSYFFPQYAKVAHLVLWCLGSSCIFVLVVVIAVSQVELCYIRLSPVLQCFLFPNCFDLFETPLTDWNQLQIKLDTRCTVEVVKMSSKKPGVQNFLTQTHR
jgi:hypothetical protein